MGALDGKKKNERRVRGLGFRVQGSRFRLQGLGFRALFRASLGPRARGQLHLNIVYLGVFRVPT